MFKSVAAVECRGASVFGLGLKTVAARGDIILDELKKLRAKSAASVLLLDVYLLDPYDSAARLLRVRVGENTVSEDVSVILKDKSVTVRRARKEKIAGICDVFLRNILKHSRGGIKILRHFGVDLFVVLCDFSDCHFVKVMYFSCGEK